MTQKHPRPSKKDLEYGPGAIRFRLRNRPELRKLAGDAARSTASRGPGDRQANPKARDKQRLACPGKGCVIAWTPVRVRFVAKRISMWATPRPVAVDWGRCCGYRALMTTVQLAASEDAFLLLRQGRRNRCVHAWLVEEPCLGNPAGQRRMTRGVGE